MYNLSVVLDAEAQSFFTVFSPQILRDCAVFAFEHRLIMSVWESIFSSSAGLSSGPPQVKRWYYYSYQEKEPALATTFGSRNEGSLNYEQRLIAGAVS